MISRRQLGLGFGAAGAVIAMPRVLRAQAYPSQDISFICAFAPGSGADVLVRYFAAKIGPLAGRNIIVENKVGAAGRMALEHLARAKPDGHTIFVHAASGAAASMHLVKRPVVDVPKQIRVAATINEQAYVIVVDGASPHKSFNDLTAALKAKGDKASYGAANQSAQIMSEIYKLKIGAPTVQVLYKNSKDMMNDLANGQLEFGAIDPVLALAQQRAGRLRILAISSSQRMKAMGDLPTMAEHGVPVNITGWWAAMVPAETPQPVRDQINKWFVAVVSSPEAAEFLTNAGGDPLIMSQADAQARLVREIDDWAEWVRVAKIEPQG